jgi:hypothetical protein
VSLWEAVCSIFLILLVFDTERLDYLFANRRIPMLVNYPTSTTAEPIYSRGRKSANPHVSLGALKLTSPCSGEKKPGKAGQLRYPKLRVFPWDHTERKNRES